MVKKRQLQLVICAMTTCLAAMMQHHQQLLLMAAMQEDSDADDEDDHDDDDHGNDDTTTTEEQPKAKRTRCSYGRPDYNSSGWAVMLRETQLLADPTSQEAKNFRSSFRVPYPFFLDLVKQVKAGEWEGFMANTTGVGRLNYISVELKVLAVLYILGKGNSFDDVSQMSRLSVPTVQRIFHAFMEHYAKELYSTKVVKPTGRALESTLKSFDTAGFPGAVGLTAVTHIHWQHAPFSAREAYVGKEEGLPTLAFECTVDRSGRCLAAAKGIPGAQRDSAVALSDDFVQEVREGDYKDVEFTLKDEDGEDVKEKGLYLLAGGEHHLWRCLQCPAKAPTTQAELAYRWHHGNVHKGAESFFETLKGRFRILKAPCLYKKKDCVDNVFLTCCILHNMLLDFNGIELLEEGMDWKGVDGAVDPPEEVNEVVTLPTPPTAPVVPEKIEIESDFHSLRKKLVANFMFRKNQGTLDEPV